MAQWLSQVAESLVTWIQFQQGEETLCSPLASQCTDVWSLSRRTYLSVPSRMISSMASSEYICRGELYCFWAIRGLPTVVNPVAWPRTPFTFYNVRVHNGSIHLFRDIVACFRKKIHLCSEDPNASYLDPDPEFGFNLDLDSRNIKKGYGYNINFEKNAKNSLLFE